ALGVAYLAGLATGVWESREEIKKTRVCDARFVPDMDAEKRKNLLAGWRKAVGRSLDWETH
ncbi:MAG: glycerol kinase, partial [Eubacteriales bacterium]